MALTLGTHTFPDFNGLSIAFGASLEDYPPYKTIPEKFRRGKTPANNTASLLFFKGGKLSDFGFQLKKGVNSSEFYRAVQALLCSFDPQHDHKEATVAWLIDEYTEPAGENK